MAYGTKQTSNGNGIGEWFSRFSATTCGVVIGGLVLLGVVRFYIYWSVRDSAEKYEQKLQEKKNQPAIPK